MARFKFRLQRVLDFRTSEKKDRERELALKNSTLRQAELHRDEIIKESETAIPPVSEALSMAELALIGQYQERLRDALVQQRLLILEAAQAVDQAREAYIEKAVETGVLEEVKDRKFGEFREEQQRQDKRAIDEIVIQRHRLTKRLFGRGGE